MDNDQAAAVAEVHRIIARHKSRAAARGAKLCVPDSRGPVRERLSRLRVTDEEDNEALSHRRSRLRAVVALCASVLARRLLSAADGGFFRSLLAGASSWNSSLGENSILAAGRDRRR
jgi:hypothetical protein